MQQIIFTHWAVWNIDMRELRSEHISNRLLTAMMIILLSLLLISVPLIIRSYQNYQINQHAQVELESLKFLADLANQISRERAPTNNLMSSSADEFAFHRNELNLYRNEVDELLNDTIAALHEGGFDRVANYLEVDFRTSLTQGRAAVDAYAALKPEQRSMLAMDHAIAQMFNVWDSIHDALKMVVNQSHGKETAVAHYYTLILFLAEFRDQAGRAGSNVIAPITFNQPIPETNLARFLQTKRQSQYLWQMTDVLLPEHDKTAEYSRLYLDVEHQFLAQSLPMLEKLINESPQGDYSVSPTQLTQSLSTKFLTVVDLQKYLLQYSIDEAKRYTHQAKKQLWIAILITLVAIFTTIFSMIYLQRYVFEPLIHARRLLIDLSKTHSDTPDHIEASPSLFSAITHLQEMLRQRDHMEFKLKNLANTDSLTGVANRFALDEFIKVLESRPTRFTQTCLMVVDIDHFKTVNDTHGHIFGDQVIQWVADTLKRNVRTTDLLVRYGGDEFVVLLEHVNLTQALHIAEKIRAEIRAAKILADDDQPIPVSVSIGVAVGASSWLSLLEKADQALFKAKAAGRNTVSS